ncbi:MAG: OPT oligopeptide transporter protein [Candidatus Aminicenantes bacterium ADurb.Bin508]|nr:MAG: OPT oligopeptide transporter protein [Candidatus Aminicenantes bacterium ADurb.Bin508]HPT00466.1 oligopeptide transporter, OPT family [Candidatus Aminicenantes bacterium]
MGDENGGKRELAENAYRKLNPGEVYTSFVPSKSEIPEVTFRSVIWGTVMAALFSGAAAFLGLKVAQVFEAAIPIAILAVGMAGLFKRKSTILENIIIQSIGACSGMVVAGAIFTLPGIFVLRLDKTVGINFWDIFLASLFGGVLGILFMIPFRKYFVSEMHGEFPFPEATATTEVLVAGEKGGKQAKVLVMSMVVGGLYDFCVHTLALFREVFTTRSFGWGVKLAERSKIVFKLDVLAAVLGLGYIVGLKYGAIICAGSLVSWWVFIPLVNHIGGASFHALPAEVLFTQYVRPIGIGAIAAAGIIGILKSSGVIVQAFGTGIKGIFKRKSGSLESSSNRTDRDLPMTLVFAGMVLVAIVVFLFFRLSVLSGASGISPTKISLIALCVVLVISFLFTSVAARATAIVGTNPVSGMTLMTLLLSSVILASSGLSGEYGMMAALVIGGVVCTALSCAGAFVTDLKVGYWLGSTPMNQQRFKFLGVLVAALSVGVVILLLHKTYGFVPVKNQQTLEIAKIIQTAPAGSPEAREALLKMERSLDELSAPQPVQKSFQELKAQDGQGGYVAARERFLGEFQSSEPLPAPQANAMAAVIKPLMEKQSSAPWMLYLFGVFFAVIMEMVGVPPLAFALGMYIPLELNTPFLLGGFLSYLVKKSTKDADLSQKRQARGTLIASGFIAGGAIIGIVAALLKYVNLEEAIRINLAQKPIGEWLALVMFILISIYVYVDSRRASRED